MLYSKWIIEDSKLTLGKVTYHKQLAVNTKNVKGGGSFTLDSEAKTLLLWGKSHDFGSAELDLVKQAFDSGMMYTGARKLNKVLSGYALTFQDECYEKTFIGTL